MLIGNPEIHHYTSDKKILIISDLSLRHSQYIEEYISDILAVHKIHSETTAITEDQLSKYNLLEYDLIVTNQPILNAHVPHILIDDSVPFATEEELIRLFEICIIKKQLCINHPDKNFRTNTHSCFFLLYSFSNPTRFIAKVF